MTSDQWINPIFVAAMAFSIGQIARYGATAVTPGTLSFVVTGATLISIIAGVYLAKEE